ncbi:unnamed protein product [Cuscuta epithymum]|uniref:Homeobox domain-containing protein n=1 Tax=Cuscuta epithymum TaxID=186058 RepID=A0AAV0EJ78_9ASTE|nr:unnamed protein product [Cuscuta epithymum]
MYSGESNNDDGFGLSLSLAMQSTYGPNSGFEPTHSFPLNLLHPRLLSFMHQNDTLKNLPTSTSVSGVEEKSGEGRRYERAGIDINQPALTTEYDEHVMVASSPRSTAASTVTGKRSEREFDAEEEAAAEMTGSSMDEDGGDEAAAAARKKLRLTKEQAAVLEDTFKGHCTLNPKQKVALAKQLNLKPRQVEVWFQNRRARTKLKQTEVDCEYLRRCCERLAEENRRLVKEVGDLRALRLPPPPPPQGYMNMTPPTTLIMCSQCQRTRPSHSSSCDAATSPLSTTVACHPQHPPPAPLMQWAAMLQSQSSSHRHLEQLL